MGVLPESQARKSVPQPGCQMVEGASSEQAVSSLYPRAGVLESPGQPSGRRLSTLERSKCHLEKKEPASVNAPDQTALLSASIWSPGGAFGVDPWPTAGLKHAVIENTLNCTL